MSNRIKCTTCIFRFECLAKHYIPKNFGNDCRKYKDVKNKAIELKQRMEKQQMIAYVNAKRTFKTGEI